MAADKKAEGVEPREILEKTTEAAKEYADLVSSATMAGIASAFQLQNSVITGARSMADAGVEASRAFADEWAKAVREGQTQTTKLAGGSAQLIERAFETK